MLSQGIEPIRLLEEKGGKRGSGTASHKQFEQTLCKFSTYFGRTMPLNGRLRPVGDMTLNAESPSSGPGGTPPIQRSDGFW